MKKLLNIIVCGLVLVGVSVLATPPVMAQFVKADATKTPSKTTIWFQTQKAKCEKAIEWVQNSQFGQFVGDGIKYTKEGIKFAKDTYEKGMELYNQTKDAVLNSAEYKAAMISKDIATESKKLKSMQEEKLKKQEDIEQEIELLKEQTEAKVKSVQENLNVAEQSYAKDPAKANDENAPVVAPTAAAQSMADELSQIEDAAQSQIDDYGMQMDSIDDEYQGKILEQGEKIAELTKKLSEVASSGGMISKKAKDPAKAVEETHNKVFTADVPSIREEQKIKQKRQEMLGDTITETMNATAELGLNQSANQDKVESKQETGDTMPGESEGAGVSAEVLAEQMKILQSYINLVIADLKLQTSLEVNRLRKINSVPVKSTFNLCDYTDPKNVGLTSGVKAMKDKADGLMDKAKDAYAKGQDAYAKGQETVNKAKDQYNQVKDQVDAAKDLAAQAGDVASSLKDQAAGAAGSVADPATMGVF